MIAFVRYTSGLGNSALYARIRNATGQFWDFAGEEWVTPITADCKGFLTEASDGDPTTSYYGAEIDVPTADVYCIEAVLASNGTVLGYESTRDAVLVARTSNAETGVIVADGSNSAIAFKTDLFSAVSGYCMGSFVKFTSGALINQIRRIAGYSGTSNFIIAASAFTGVPAANDEFIIVNQ